MRNSPVYTVLSERPLFLGGEFKLVMGNLAIGAVLTFIIGLVVWPIVMLIVHVLLVQLAKRDPMAREIYRVYARQGDRYEPWVYPDTPMNDRPGFAKDSLL